MADGRLQASDDASPSWVRWFAWAWVALVVLAALATLLDLEGLRLSIDFQRHLH